MNNSEEGMGFQREVLWTELCILTTKKIKKKLYVEVLTALSQNVTVSRVTAFR